MFLYNFKVNSNKLVKCVFIILFIIVLVIFSIGIYDVFFKKDIPEQIDDSFSITDTINTDKIFEITSNNYTNILDAVTNDLNSYIGCKIHFIGFIYRLIDFKSDEFVLARNMIVNESTGQSVVVGFLCKYMNATDFPDNTWVDVTGIIQKGDYYGDIPIIEIKDITKCAEPNDKYVHVPDKNYIPTNGLI